MLKIFNDMQPFFEDSYQEIGVREYARISNISPPTASKTLKGLESEGLLKLKRERGWFAYRANRENPLFIDLARAYWRQKLATLTNALAEKIDYNTIVLFGSLAKGEAKIDSDIDLYLDIAAMDIDLKDFERNLKRKVQLHFKSSKKVLINNVRKGLSLYGAII